MANLPTTEDQRSMLPSQDSYHIHNPYYLHPGDSLESVLVTSPLQTNNYDSWMRAMKKTLLSKNKFKFVDGTIKPPPHSSFECDIWERCNTMVISYITRCLIPSIAQSTIYIDNAQELWPDLRERFSEGDHFRMLDVLQEIHSMRQGERSISDFHTNLKTLWEELESLRPLPSCICENKCNCGSTKVIKDQREVEHVICFLKGLNDEFSSTRAQILLMDHLPQINKAFSLVLQQERQVNGASLSVSKVMFNYTNEKPTPTKTDTTQQWKPRFTQPRGSYI
ncbi:PREDICTED: uncharacterized protein LOC109338504 [Lupinus angustifolius]|uniref:uncharacterized protein LOC109338504 n=1 Tax=Lupinus angustifolius TaxID=3871 RepID=UPI00092F8B96|nr:PREDICTED: uncharacterized protein LOC109338504 [Lupinus angustifolius]